MFQKADPMLHYTTCFKNLYSMFENIRLFAKENWCENNTSDHTIYLLFSLRYHDPSQSLRFKRFTPYPWVQKITLKWGKIQYQNNSAPVVIVMLLLLLL